MKTLLTPIFSLSLILFLGACGDPEAPPGFTLDIQLQSLQSSAVDELRLIFRPQAGEVFSETDMAVYEDGAITATVTTDGDFVIAISGPHLQSQAVDGRYNLEIWTSDEMMSSAAPRVLASALQSDEVIGSGAVFLPEWPIPLGQTTQITVSCRPDFTEACAR